MVSQERRATYKPPSYRMQEGIAEWIKNGSPSEVLAGWLEGWSLPATQRDADPFYTIWAGLTRGTVEEKLNLASSLGELLRSRLPSNSPRQIPERLLFNALTLSAMLGLPNELADPLQSLRDRHEDLGSWNGFDLNESLSRAIERNPLIIS